MPNWAPHGRIVRDCKGRGAHPGRRVIPGSAQATRGLVQTRTCTQRAARAGARIGLASACAP